MKFPLVWAARYLDGAFVGSVAVGAPQVLQGRYSATPGGVTIVGTPPAKLRRWAGGFHNLNLKSSKTTLMVHGPWVGLAVKRELDARVDSFVGGSDSCDYNQTLAL